MKRLHEKWESCCTWSVDCEEQEWILWGIIIIDEEKIPDVLITVFKNKWDTMNCANYRGIKLMCHSVKLYERVHDNRLRNIVSISEVQFEFVKGESTTNATVVQERYREKDSKTYTVCSLIWRKHTTESRGKNCIGACETRGCQRSTSDWWRTCTINAKL